MACHTSHWSPLRPRVPNGLGNYRELMSVAIFWQSVKATAYFAAVSLTLGLLLAIGVVRNVRRARRGGPS